MMKQKLTVQLNQKNTYEKLTFPVEEGISNMCIKFLNTENYIAQLMLYDEGNNLRGQLLNTNKRYEAVLSTKEEETSPYFMPGEIHAGTWSLELGLIFLKDDEPFTHEIGVELEYNLDNLPLQNENFSFAKDILRFSKTKEGNGWYRGDFHTHTTFSDGRMSREENSEMASNRGVDFFVATDHNIFPTSWPKTDVLVVPGLEATYPPGHINLLFGDKSIFNNESYFSTFTQEGIDKLLKTAKHNGLISINHPRMRPWSWEYKDTDIEDVDCIEIINNPTYKAAKKSEEDSLVLWNHLLNDGHCIVGVGGGDSHLRPDERDEGSDIPSVISDPYNYLYCGEKMTFHRLRSALQSGNVVVSRNEFIDLRIADKVAGERITDTAGIAKMKIEDAKKDFLIEWIVDGEIVQKTQGVQDEYAFDFSNGAYHWIRTNIRELDGRLYGFTNPIFFGEKKHDYTKMGQIYESIEGANEERNSF